MAIRTTGQPNEKRAAVNAAVADLKGGPSDPPSVPMLREEVRRQAEVLRRVTDYLGLDLGDLTPEG